MYMLPNDINLRIGKIENYNNKVLVSLSSFNIGTTSKTNLDDDKHIKKDKPDVKPDIKSKKKDKQDVKIIKAKPDMNEITYEEEQAALILGITAKVNIQMIYFLLASVIKYLCI